MEKRLLLTTDDFGMCHAENAATIAGLEQGAFCSSTIMPWCARDCVLSWS